MHSHALRGNEKNIQLFVVGWASFASYELGGQDAQRQSPTEGNPPESAGSPTILDNLFAGVPLDQVCYLSLNPLP